MTEAAPAVANGPRVDNPLRVLSLLAKKNAYGERTARDGAWALTIWAPRGGAVACVGTAAAHAHDPAIDNGWIAPDPDGKWRLTRRGRDCLRRGLSAGDGVRALPAPAPPPRGRAKPGFNAAESPLAWLRQRKAKDGRPMIGQAQFEAGERFRADFCAGRMTAHVTTNWSEPLGGRSGDRAGLEFSERASAAQERVRRALAAVGPELSGVLVDVCGHLKNLEETESARQWPQRSAKLVLILALTSLARHYGMIERPAHAGGVRHRGAADYQPCAMGPPPGE